MFQSLPVPYLTGFKISQNDALRWMMEMFYSSHIPDNDPWVGVSQKSFPVCLVWFDDDNSVRLRDRLLAPSSRLCHIWLCHWRGTLYLRAAVHWSCQHPLKGLGTNKTVEASKHTHKHEAQLPKWQQNITIIAKILKVQIISLNSSEHSLQRWWEAGNGFISIHVH